MHGNVVGVRSSGDHRQNKHGGEVVGWPWELASGREALEVVLPAQLKEHERLHHYCPLLGVH
jgi:hypothetical protein